MGQEASCSARIGKQRVTGKALLETSEVIFRPADGSPRTKIPFSAIEAAKAVNGELRLQTAEGTVVFELGAAAAEKWCEKILHPKTRAEKLGVKPNMHVCLLGEFDADFLRELRGATKNIHEGKSDSDSELIFLSVGGTKGTSGIARAAKTLKGATGLWVVYPKGRKELTETDVIAAGRKAGLKDVKVVGFSATHTALKFIIPVDRR
jgi:hypothetical protein